MSSEPPTSSLASEDAPPEQLVVNLQIVSPSVGVNRPLLFPRLPAATTIKELKEKIRQTLPLRPADENQRLIHRGRALMRETDSLLDVFGADVLRDNSDLYTIHLVLRDAPDSHSTMHSSTGGTASPAPTGQAANSARMTPPHPIFGQQPPANLTRRTPFQTTALPFPQPSGPSPNRPLSPAHTSEQAAAFQHQHQSMTSWLTQIQREAMARAIASQNNPRPRTHLGMRVGDVAPNNGGHGSENNSGRASPVNPVHSSAPTHTIYREAIGPNGHSYHMETVIRTAGPSISPAPASVLPWLQGGLAPTDVQNIIRGADSSNAANNIANSLHRTVSNPSLQNRPLTQLGASSSVFVPGGSRTSSGRATPDHGLRPPAVGLMNNASGPAFIQPQARQGVEVYILSSPEGPRALVFNNAASETYYTPRMFMQPSPHQFRAIPGLGFSTLSHVQPHSFDDTLQPHSTDRGQTAQYQALVQGYQQPQQPQQEQQRQQLQPQQQQQPPQQEPGLGFHPNNPVAGGLPALFFQLIPHFGLILRLALFVWLFTSPTASWTRWITMISLAAFLFALSTGILNGLAEHAWRPLGRHLENIFPAAEYARGAPEGAMGQEGGRVDTGDRGPNHDPARMAARLVAQHRERQPWFLGHARRLERALLLFVASIAPGVAERHIAFLEEEGRRREREAAAAAAAAAAATTAEDNMTAPEADENANLQQQRNDNEHGRHGNEAMREDLIAL